VERLLQQTTSEDRRLSAPVTKITSADVVGDDMIKIIRTVKDSVAAGGGLTAEVKALVRELRGEVLGMGREIGRRLDELNAKRLADAAASSSSRDVPPPGASKAEV